MRAFIAHPLPVAHHSSISLSRRRPPVSQLPPSVATVHHGRTNATVHIIGCVHGSQISADDVRHTIDSVHPSAVVVELCEPRLISFRKSLLEKDSKKTRRSFGALRQMFGGIGPALVAWLLESVYTLQKLCGVTPGVEFQYAIEAARGKWGLICGDAPAKETVRNLYGILNPRGGLKEAWEGLTGMGKRFGEKEGVHLVELFVRDGRRVRELAKLVLPTGGVAGLVGGVGNAMASVIDGSGGATDLGAWGAGLDGALTGVFVIMLLRFIKVLIVDRDHVIAQNIIEVLENRGGVIVVVVGMLHVNGLTAMLRTDGKKSR